MYSHRWRLIFKTLQSEGQRCDTVHRFKRETTEGNKGAKILRKGCKEVKDKHKTK
jgi:hypothetical protein